MIHKLCDWANSRDEAVACVYCDFRARNEHSATELLGVLLKQVVGAQESIPDEVQTAYNNSQRGLGGRRLSLPDILEILIKSCQKRVFICIDALDEFSAKRRPELWKSLQQIVRKCPNTRLFLTGRLHIREEVQEYFPARAEMLRISPKEPEIMPYLRVQLAQALGPGAVDEALIADIQTFVLGAVVPP